MKDVSDPFITFAEVNPDFNQSDDKAACAQLIERQDVIDQWLHGETHVEHVLDTLSDQGMNPDEYVQSVCEAVDFAIKGGIVFESNESGLFLPVL